MTESKTSMKCEPSQPQRFPRSRYIGIGCLFLLALLFWRVTADFGGQDLRSIAPTLDSFSEPSVCLARLRHEADRLMLAYTEKRDAEVQETTLGVNGQQNRPFHGEALAKLHAEVQELEINLNRKVLVTYLRSGRWSQFVDCYLVELVGHSHEKVVGEALTYSALDCAQKCGRLEEVVDALHHVIRFHPNFHAVGAFKEALEKWQTHHPTKAGEGPQ